MKKLIEFINTNPSEKECLEFLEKIYWKGTPVSPYDKSSKVYKCKAGYKCDNSNKYFNVRIGTIFAETKTPLISWFKAIVLSFDVEMSSYKLAKEVGIGQKSAWFMLNRFKNETVKYAYFIYLVL